MEPGIIVPSDRHWEGKKASFQKLGLFRFENEKQLVNIDVTTPKIVY